MALSLLGILSAAGAGGAGPSGGAAYELIESSILLSNTATVTFSSIPQDFKHLEIRAISSNASGSGSVSLRLNGDTGSNYAQHSLEGNGSLVASSANTSTAQIVVYPHGVNSASGNGAAIISILDYANTAKNKTIRSLNGVVTTFNQVGLNSGFRNNTEAITSIALFHQAGTNFRSGSRFSLYGIKG
jgi:hypothetical protein